MAKKRVLAVCGTGGVTSSVMADKVREIAKANGVEVEIVNAKVFEVKAQLASGEFDLIVAATRVSNPGDVPVVNAMSFLTGVGEEKTVAEIGEMLTGGTGEDA
jgi:PTS system galactitol-specific IIB component